MRRLMLLLSVFVLSHSSFAAKPPNILWLIGENLSHDLGCYGAKDVHMPNLDKLAAEGVRYTRVFSTNPACAPSRSAFFTAPPSIPGLAVRRLRKG
jgi:N-sulfoglucosamine sulfohydrolase